jgi:SAM-dependent methyltransferase
MDCSHDWLTPSDVRPGHDEPEACYRALVWATDHTAHCRPEGDIFESACGPGSFTCELVRHAQSVTVIDASRRMLALNRERVADPKVRYLNADIFTWTPDRLYDVVFFANWLSHIPLTVFDAFWNLVRTSLRPHGRGGFVDEDERAIVMDTTRLVGGVPAARRTLRDRRQFDIVKDFWNPTDLERAEGT